MDWDKLRDVEIYGGENEDEHQRIEFLTLPCNYLHKGYSEDTIHPECIGNLEAQQKYLGALNWKVLHTQERFNPNGFGDDTITKNSFLFNMQVDNTSPNWVRGQLNINEVADESQTI